MKGREGREGEGGGERGGEWRGSRRRKEGVGRKVVSELTTCCAGEEIIIISYTV